MRIDTPRKYVVDNLDALFEPDSIAVIGASRNPEKVGNRVIAGLEEWGYQGKIYPVNPRASEIRGLKAYPTVDAIEEPVDLAYITVPANIIKVVLEQCVNKGVRMAVIATSGFKEIGNAELQDNLTNYCRENKLPMVGPNLLGMGNPYLDFNCGFIPYKPNKGPLGLASQSGSNLLAALGVSTTHNLGLSWFVGLGNKADVDFSELILYGLADEHTKAIALYGESLDSPKAFLKAAKEAVPEKPIVLLKTGFSEIGKKAALAHTASENPKEDDFYDELCAEAGVIRARQWQEFLDIGLALANQKPLFNDNVVMITNGGGSGLLSSDHFERLGMPMRSLEEISPALEENIKAYMPSFGSVLNPVDISGTATRTQYKGATSIALRDENVSCVYVSICPTAATDVPGITKDLIEIHEANKDSDKSLIVEAQGGKDCQEAIYKLREHGIAAYPTPEQAVNGIVALRKYGKILEDLDD